MTYDRKTLAKELQRMLSPEMQIKKIINEQLGTPLDQITLEANIINDLGADSLDLVELVMALEEEFRIEVPDDDAKKLTTVGKAVAYVVERLKA